MNNFTIINKAEQDVAKAKEHLSVLKQKITDSKAKLEEAKADYEANVNSSSTDNSELHNLILSVDLIKVELKKAEDSLVALNNDIENAKEESQKISEEYSIAKQKTIETGNQFYDVKKKADVFKDSINKVTDNLKAKKAVYDEYINASDNSSDKVNQAKAELEALQTKYSEAVKSIKDLQDEYDRNTALIASRKNMLDKATADADEKKKAYEQDRSAESIKKVAYDRTVEAQNRLKPAYEEAVGVETTAKESYEEAVRLLDEANKTYDDAVNDEAAKERKYNSQVDIGRDSHNYDYDSILDSLRADSNKLSTIKDFSIENPEIQDYCKNLILYNLTVHDYKDISFGDWIINLRGLGVLSYIQVKYTFNGIPDKCNYSCECNKNSDNRIEISECDISDMSNVVKKPFISDNDILKGTDLYQLSLKSIQDDINRAEVNYNNAKTV